MEDHGIVDLYWRRDERAIHETARKYDRYLTAIMLRILDDPEDGRECVNDIYLKLWESIPPERPEQLERYLGRLARRAAIDRWRRRHSQKRAGSEYALTLDELAECVSGGDDTVQAAELRLLSERIAAYLHTLSAENRMIFVRRYYDLDPIRTIADRCGCGESRIKSRLLRLRRGLADYLKKEGFDL